MGEFVRQQRLNLGWRNAAQRRNGHQYRRLEPARHNRRGNASRDKQTHAGAHVHALRQPLHRFEPLRRRFTHADGSQPQCGAPPANQPHCEEGGAARPGQRKPRERGPPEWATAQFPVRLQGRKGPRLSECKKGSRRRGGHEAQRRAGRGVPRPRAHAVSGSRSHRRQGGGQRRALPKEVQQRPACCDQPRLAQDSVE